MIPLLARLMGAAFALALIAAPPALSQPLAFARDGAFGWRMWIRSDPFRPPQQDRVSLA